MQRKSKIRARPRSAPKLESLDWKQRNQLAEKVGGILALAKLVKRSQATVSRWLKNPSERTEGHRRGAREPKGYEMALLLEIWYAK